MSVIGNTNNKGISQTYIRQATDEDLRRAAEWIRINRPAMPGDYGDGVFGNIFDAWITFGNGLADWQEQNPEFMNLLALGMFWYTWRGDLKSTIPQNTGGAGKTGADNIATLPKLNAQLTYEEASSVFTKSGTLKPEVINNSNPIISGSELGNKKVIDALTSNGSSINDWAKMSTQTFKSPSGDFQVHFYKNLKTGEVSTYEMKVKFNMQGAKK